MRALQTAADQQDENLQLALALSASIQTEQDEQRRRRNKLNIWAPCEFWQTSLDWVSVSDEGLFCIAQISQRALGG